MNSQQVKYITFYVDLLSVLWLQQDPPLAGESQGSVVLCVPMEWQTLQDLLMLLHIVIQMITVVLFQNRNYGCKNLVSNM